MTCTRVKIRPKGLLLVLAYAVAIPVWVLSMPLIVVASVLE